MPKKEKQKLGIIAHGAYIPFWRLERSEIAKTLSTTPLKGERRVAGFDEDTTTMGVAAAKLAFSSSESSNSKKTDELHQSIAELWFSTAEPPYLEKTNATVIHSALRLEQSVSALDFGGASRSGIGALRSALNAASNNSGQNNLVVLSGLRTGLPASEDEAMGGDGAAAFIVGTEDLIAEYVGGASATQEFLDRWRNESEPFIQQPFTQQWEERFAEQPYLSLFNSALSQALQSSKLEIKDLDSVAVIGTHSRSVKSAARSFDKSQLADDLMERIGNTGAAHPGLVLSEMLSTAKPNQTLAVIWLADGVEILLFKTTEAIAKFSCAKPLSKQLEQGNTISYATFLRWRKILKVQPPNRPEPPRISAPAALRGSDFKHGFVGSRGDISDTLHLPPNTISINKEDTSEMLEAPMADVLGEIVTYTIDRLVYSESPPVIFAIINFEGGGRFTVEMTDVEEPELDIGMKVEMVFRKLYTAGGIHNYFYKARPNR